MIILNLASIWWTLQQIMCFIIRFYSKSYTQPQATCKRYSTLIKPSNWASQLFSWTQQYKNEHHQFPRESNANADPLWIIGTGLIFLLPRWLQVHRPPWGEVLQHYLDSWKLSTCHMATVMYWFSHYARAAGSQTDRAQVWQGFCASENALY